MASIPNTTNPIIKEATNTIIALLCNSPQVGQVTLVINSWYDSRKYVLTFCIGNLYFQLN